MELIEKGVVYVILACAVIGAIAAVRNDKKGLGKEFIEGLYSIGPIFLPVAGIMASVPLLSRFIEAAFGPAFAALGADPAMAATTLIAVDMGGFVLARELAGDTENWLMAMTAGYMAGATIVFSIPVGLAMLSKRDHKYLALGMMAGILSIPIGVLVSSSLLVVLNPLVRDTVSATAAADYQLALGFSTVMTNLVPLAIICVVLALGLRFFPAIMIKLFLLFGRCVYAAITLIVALCIVEHFTKAASDAEPAVGLFATLFGAWPFDPIIMVENDESLRALEVAGYIGIMLAGAFPMVYLIKKFLAKPMEVLGSRVGLDSSGAAGILAASANILAMFRLIDDMRAKDKVLCIAFAVCSAFLFGDHLAFTANFQPTMIVPVMLGKLTGGIAGFLLALWLSVPKAVEMEKAEGRPADPEEVQA